MRYGCGEGWQGKQSAEPHALPCSTGEEFCPPAEPKLSLQHTSLSQHRAGPRAACSTSLLSPWACQVPRGGGEPGLRVLLAPLELVLD